jgi:hypothetical protein
MTSCDLDMLLVNGRVSLDDSAILMALANALEILGSWSSYKKTHVETIA